MKLEDYFDFLAPNDIRIKGSRIGIETILYDFIHRSRTPEEIINDYPSLTLEKVYATITYYYYKREAIDKYLTQWIEWGDQMRAEQAKTPTPAMLKLLKIKEELKTEYGSIHNYLEAKRSERTEISSGRTCQPERESSFAKSGSRASPCSSSKWTSTEWA